MTALVHLSRVHLQAVLPLFLCIFIFVTAVTVAWVNDTVLKYEFLVCSVIVFSTQLLATRDDPRQSQAKASHKAVCEEHERVSQLLQSMLPHEVLAEMKSNSLSLAYSYENMTLLFADIVGFTRYCAHHTPEQAVNLVTRLFAEFDEATVRFGVYKVCTIGDAYVVVNEPRTDVLDRHDDCECVLLMAEHMLQAIVQLREEIQNEDLNMRIGLHCGSFVGGVVGTKRLRFDIWGEDVLIANTIESNGIPGCICVSEQAKEVLEEGFHRIRQLNFVFQTDVKLKNRGVRSYMAAPLHANDEHLQ